MTQQDHLEQQLKRFVVEPSVDNGYVVRDLWSGASCGWHGNRHDAIGDIWWIAGVSARQAFAEQVRKQSVGATK